MGVVRIAAATEEAPLPRQHDDEDSDVVDEKERLSGSSQSLSPMVATIIPTKIRNKSAVIGATFVLASTGVFLLDPGLRSFLNSNEGALSALLTFMLVVLYVGQYRLLNRQVRLENRPHLVVEEYDEEGNEIRALLSNLGNGVATEIELETRIDFDGGGIYSPSRGRWTMRKIGEEGDKKRRVGNSLKSGRNYERFIGKAMTGLLVDGEYQGYGLRAATSQLAMEGVETVTVEFFVVNSDLLGNEYQAPIYGGPYEVDLEPEGLGVKEVKLKGHPATSGWEDF